MTPNDSAPKMPALQFYVGDWRKDLGVQALSYHDRGVWFEILLLMHESEQRGKLLLNGRPMPESVLARLLGIAPAELESALANILDFGVASRDPETGVIFNRRMVKDEHVRSVRHEAGAAGAARRWNKQPEDGFAMAKPMANSMAKPMRFDGSSSSSSSSSSTSVEKPPVPPSAPPAKATAEPDSEIPVTTPPTAADLVPPPSARTKRTPVPAALEPPEPAAKKAADPRSKPFQEAVSVYYEHKNPGITMPWDGSEGRQLACFLRANPSMTLETFRTILRNRAKSGVNHAERPNRWLAQANTYAGGPIDRFGQPLPAGVPNGPHRESGHARTRQQRIDDESEASLERIAARIMGKGSSSQDPIPEAR